MRRLALLLGPPLVGALLGALVFRAVLHDPLGAPAPAALPADTAGWRRLFDVGFGLAGAVVGGGVGLLFGLAAALWDSRRHRAI